MTTDPLSDRYIRALQQHAKANPESEPPVGWRCQFCSQAGWQRDEEAVLEHVFQMHPAKVLEEKGGGPAKFELWRKEVASKSMNRGSGTSPAAAGDSRSKDRNGTPESGGKVMSSRESSGAFGFNRLSLNQQPSVDSSEPRTGDKRPLSTSHQPRAHPGWNAWPSGESRSQRRQSPRHHLARRREHRLSGGHSDTELKLQDPSRLLATNTDVTNDGSIRASPTKGIASSPAAEVNPSLSQPVTPPPTNAVAPLHQPAPPPQPSGRQRTYVHIPVDPRWPGMLLQPNSRPISQEQLAAEVKSIYSGLSMIEAKCINVDKAQAAAMADPRRSGQIPGEHWIALISLHRTLLHEHHDFFLASQHPAASLALRRLAARHNMPARMWKNGIHSFLELLRHQLPASLEYMISFIYLAYQMMSLLYETAPSFEDTWIECLGDLSRYRMAVEDDIRDREVWASVARFWYSKAADRLPTIGRLYHHLAILARPNAIQQLYLYCRSLISGQAFLSARESIQTLLDPVLKDTASHISQIDTHFIKRHALFFKGRPSDAEESINTFQDLLLDHISRYTTKWREDGVYIAVADLAAMFNYGGNDQPLRRVFDIGNLTVQQSESPSPDTTERLSQLRQLPKADDPGFLKIFQQACTRTYVTFAKVLKRHGDRNTHPYIHVQLVFLKTLLSFDSFEYSQYLRDAIRCILAQVPLYELCQFLTALSRSEDLGDRFETLNFLQSEEDDRPLPEDHLIRGIVFSLNYFADGWFDNIESDDEYRSVEHASTVKMRAERLLWLGYCLSTFPNFIIYDKNSKSWMPATTNINTESTNCIPENHQVALNTFVTDIPRLDTFDELYAYESSEGDSVDMKELGRDARRPHSTSGLTLTVPSPTEMPEGAAEVAQNKYGILVLDITVIKTKEIFEFLVKSKWKLYIPATELATLSSQSKEEESESEDATMAVKAVKRAITDTDKVRIIDSRFIDVTEESRNDVRCTSSNVGSAEDKEEVLIGITRSASGLKELDEVTESKPAVLLTDNKETRDRADAQGVHSMAASIIKYLMPSAGRLRRLSSASLSSIKSGCSSPGVQETINS